MTGRTISQANSTLVFSGIGIYLIITANSLEEKKKKEFRNKYSLHNEASAYIFYIYVLKKYINIL